MGRWAIVNLREQVWRQHHRRVSSMIPTNDLLGCTHFQGMSGKGGMIGRGIGGSNMMGGQQQQSGMMMQQQQPGMMNNNNNNAMQQNNMMMGGGQQTQQQQQNNQQKPFNSILGSGPNSNPATSTMNQPQQNAGGGGVFSTASNLFSGATNAATGGLFSSGRQQPQKGVPQIVPTMGVGQQQQQQQQQQFNQQQQGQQNQQGFGPGGGMQGQPGQPGGPNLMQKLTDITAPGGDMLSKGKELIFMKFGLGGK